MARHIHVHLPRTRDTSRIERRLARLHARRTGQDGVVSGATRVLRNTSNVINKTAGTIARHNPDV